MKKSLFDKAVSGRIRVAALLCLACAAGFILWAGMPGEDADNDGMNDSFERFFGLNVGVDDSAADPDRDGKDNLAESVAGTDPFNADTDLDGWDDEADTSPVSRAVYLWGDPRFTAGTTNLYVRPDWACDGLAEGGGAYAGGAYAYGWALELPVDRLLMRIDRSRVTNDLWLAVAAPDQLPADFSVSVLDSNLVALAEPMPLGSAGDPWMTNRLPLATLPEASVISLQATQGVALVVATVLYKDADGDGLDDDQNAQLEAEGGASAATNHPPAFSGLGGNAPAQVPVPVVEGIGFEQSEGYSAGALNGQQGWVASDGAVVSAEGAYAGEQCLKLLRDGPWEVTPRTASRDFGETFTGGVVWVSARIRCVPNGPRLPRSQIGAAAFVFDGLGRIVAFDGVSGQWVPSVLTFPCMTGVWARVDFCLDYSTKTYALCFQGVAVHRGLGFADASLARPNRFLMRSDSAAEGGDAGADAVVFSTEEPAGLDFDGDGIPNDLERYLGTDVWNADTDGDGLDDGLELALEYDPLQNNEDYDGDGLSNVDELAYGTDPSKADSDGDGVPDLWLESRADGISTSRRCGEWVECGTALVAVGTQTLRAEYSLPVTVPGMHRLAIEVSNATNLVSAFRFQILIDGQPFRWVEAELGAAQSVLWFETPWLVAGTHTLRIAWLDRSYEGKYLALRSVALYGVDGPDKDGDGVQDWMAARMLASGADTDGDGLSDFEEVMMGADPLNPDADGDTLSDGEEFFVFGTNPLSDDTDGDGVKDTVRAAYRTGTDTSDRRVYHITGAWTEKDGTLSSENGSAECWYDMDAPTNGGYRFGVTLRNGPTDPPDGYEYEVAVTVDGVSVGTATVRADCDVSGKGWVTLPWLQSGAHRFGLRWVNDSSQASRPTSIVIEGVELRSVNAPDTDGDGVQDWIASMLRAQGDTDGDGLSDYDEVFRYHTNPLRKDTDGDGLTDGDEVGTHGTSPLSRDSDGDGLSDAEEVGLGMDPLAADLPSAFSVIADSVQGIAATAHYGNWYAAGSELRCVRRGFAEYGLTAPATGIYAVSLDAALSWLSSADRGVYPVTSAEVLFYVDGIYLGRVRVNSADGAPDTVRVFTPCIAGGRHTVRIFYNNLYSEQRLHVRRLSLMSAPGDDADDDGVADWASALVSRRSGLDPVPAWSYVSPVCVEGATLYPSLADCTVSSGGSVSNAAVRAGVAGRWYADVPLDPQTSSVVRVGFENGAASASAAVVWRALNLASVSTGIVVRVGDSLRVACAPSGAASATVHVAAEGVGEYDVASDSAAVVRFGSPGVFTVSAVYGGEPEVSGYVEVTVVGGAFPQETPACMVTVPRFWSVPDAGDTSEIESDAGLSVASAGTNRVSLTLAEPYGPHGLVLRAFAGGPILDSKPVGGFWLQDAPESYICIVKQCDGYGIWQADLVAWGLPEGVDVVISTIVTGVLLDDYSLSRTVTVSAFDGAGQYRYNLIHPDGLSASACHTVKVYQNGEPVGEAWYSGTGIPEVLK